MPSAGVHQWSWEEGKERGAHYKAGAEGGDTREWGLIAHPDFQSPNACMLLGGSFALMRRIILNF